MMSGVGILASPALAQDPAAGQGKLTQVASFGHQVTGITVSRDGRMFVNFPAGARTPPSPSRS